MEKSNKNLQEDSLLWIPPNVESEEEFELRVQQATEANNAVSNFYSGIITLDEMFETIVDCDAVIDQYIDNFAHIIDLYEK
jgi:hypothetical protein